jgi:hypothetical protein
VNPVRRFLKQVTDVVKLIPVNPAATLWDSARKDARERRRKRG